MTTACLPDARHAFLLLMAASTLAPGQAIDTLNLRKHLRFLASDALAGRSNGSPGQQAAMEYLIAELERVGARPPDPRQGFRYRVPMGAAFIDYARVSMVLDHGRDSIPGPQFFHVSGDSASFLNFEGRTVHVGPMRARYDGAQVRGAVILAEPAPNTSLDSVAAELQRLGAAALVVTLPDSLRFAELRVARGRTRFFLRSRPRTVLERRMPVLLAHPRAADALRQARHLRLTPNPAFRDVDAFNVAAVIEGNDPARRNRHLVFTAHYDHVGIGAPIGGDSIYNGLLDNAVGVAALLEIARVAQLHRQPESMLFLFTTMEEEGSLGSAYFIAHTPIPLDRLVAAVNMDAQAPLAAPRDWYVEGSDLPRVRQAIDDLARARNEPIEFALLKANSDHWPFHSAGVPAVFPVSGNRWSDWSEERIRQETARWWRHHRVDDEWSPEFPLAGLASWAAFGLDLARALLRH